jgi:hypothetical protein
MYIPYVLEKHAVSKMSVEFIFLNMVKTTYSILGKNSTSIMI